MLYLLTSNYVGTLVEGDHELSPTEIIMACVSNGSVYTKTPEEFDKDLQEGWVSEEEWVYMDEDGFIGWVEVQNIHALDDGETLTEAGRQHLIYNFGQPVRA